MDLRIQELKRSDTTTWFALSGEILSACDFAPILNAPTENVVLDLEGVVRINSAGVRDWLMFVSSLERAGKKITLERCSVSIVQQLNVIAGFRGRGIVASVFAPYYCNSCDRGHRELIELTIDVGVPDLEQAVMCPRCKAPMEFDDLAGSYLGFQQR
jgi:eukaryotic-like serine/threonine-protein kinase